MLDTAQVRHVIASHDDSLVVLRDGLVKEGHAWLYRVDICGQVLVKLRLAHVLLQEFEVVVVQVVAEVSTVHDDAVRVRGVADHIQTVEVVHAFKVLGLETVIVHTDDRNVKANFRILILQGTDALNVQC